MFSIFLFLVCFLFTMGFLRGQVCPQNWSLTTLCLYLLLLVGKVDFFTFLGLRDVQDMALNKCFRSQYLPFSPPFPPFFLFFPFCVIDISISISEHIKFERIVCSHECIFYISQFPTFMWFELVVLFPKLCVHKLFRFRRPLLTYKTFPKILSIFCSFNRNPFCYWLQIPLYCRYFDIFTQKKKKKNFL